MSARREAASIAVVLALVITSVPFVAVGEWTPNPMRAFAQESQSRGRTFDVTISFIAPSPASSTLFVNEGKDGAEWFIPDDYAKFSVVSFSGSPAPSNYNGKASWLWQPPYTAGQTITLSYRVRVDPSVPDGVYRVNGTVGTGTPLTSVTIGGKVAISVAGLRVDTSVARTPVQRTERAMAVALVAYADGVPASGVTASATFDRTGEKVTLVPTPQPGRYEGSVKIAVDAALGPWGVSVSAIDANSNLGSSSAAFLVVKASLGIAPKPDKAVYIGGERLNLTAAPTYPDGTPVLRGSASVRLDKVSVVLPLTEGNPGAYSASYALPANAPIGRWIAAASISDAIGNDGAGPGTFDVGFVVMSPTAAPVKPVFNLMEQIVLTANPVAPDGTSVFGATVVAIFNRTGDAIPFIETSPGSYRVSYAIPPGPGLTGAWSAIVNTSFTNVAGLARGSQVVRFTLVAATLRVTVSVTTPSVQRTDSIVLRAEVRDSAGGAMTGGDVRAEVFAVGEVGVSVRLVESAPGVYGGSYRVPPNARVGPWEIVVNGNFPTAGGQGRATLTVNPGRFAATVSAHEPSVPITGTADLQVVARYLDGSAFAAATGDIGIEPFAIRAPLRETAAAGTYEGQLKVPKGSPLGPAPVSTSLLDPYGNRADGNVSIAVVRASLTVALVVADAERARTQTVSLFATVAYPDGTAVTGAAVTVRPGAGGPILVALSEGGVGYQGSLSIPVDAPLGAWTIRAEVSHADGSGAATGSLSVVPALLAVEATTDRGVVEAGEPVRITIRAAYPSGDRVSAGSVSVRVVSPRGTILEGGVAAFNANTGAFEFVFVVPDGTPDGRLNATIAVQDAHGNGGETSLSITAQAAFLRPLRQPAVVFGLVVAGIAAVTLFSMWRRGMLSRGRSR